MSVAQTISAPKQPSRQNDFFFVDWNFQNIFFKHNYMLVATKALLCDLGPGDQPECFLNWTAICS